MAWTLTDDIDAYGAAAGDLLAAQPVRYTVLLSVLGNLRRLGRTAFGPDRPVLGWWSPGGTTRAAVLQTPPHPMLVTDLPGHSAVQLAAALAERGAALAGVSGAEPDATALAAAWSGLTGCRSRVRQRQRLYRLAGLVAPESPPEGAARVASSADADIARSWYAAFSAEAGVQGSGHTVVDGRLRAGEFVLWEVAGEPAALASLTQVLHGVARVSTVYTPPALRGRGYGSALTAAVSALAIERGARSVILFTDLANPVSNQIYLRLGYVAVEDRVELAMEG